MAGSDCIPGYLTAPGRPHRALERRVIVTGVPGLRLRFYQGIEPGLRRHLIDFARWLRRAVDFMHPVRVTVARQATVMGLDGAPGWAVFLIPAADYQPGDVVRIYLAGGKLVLLVTVYGLSRESAMAQITHDLAHEVAHYEQWRDRSPLSERRANQRAAVLVASYYRSMGSPQERLDLGRPERE